MDSRPISANRQHNATFVNDFEAHLSAAHALIRHLDGELETQRQGIRQIQTEINSLRSSRRAYVSLFESAPVGYIVVDPFLQIRQINAGAAAMLGRDPENAIRTAFTQYVTPESGNDLKRTVQQACAGRKETLRIRLTDEKGVASTTQCFFYPAKGHRHRATECHITLIDIEDFQSAADQLRIARDNLQYTATHDPLTHLSNRRALPDRLESLLRHARAHTRNLAVVMLDLDQFKAINDSLGHEAGDQLLCKVAARLRSVLSDSNLIFHIGGDEFALLLTDFEYSSTIDDICSLIRNTLAEPYAINGQQMYCSASIGASLYPTDSTDKEELIRFADHALYHAKSTGRNRVCLFNNDLKVATIRQQHLKTEFRADAALRHLRIHFQPVRHVQTGNIVGLKAVSFWQHSRYGLVPLSDVYELGGNSEQRVRLFQLSIAQACHELAELHNLGYCHLTMMVSVSLQQLDTDTVIETLEKTLQTNALSADLLTLLLPESAMLQYENDGKTDLDRISSLGVRLAVDKFGDGYSSIPHLRTAHVSSISLDPSIVAGSDCNTTDRAITRALIAIARALNITVIADDVRSAEQLGLLRELGCTLYQDSATDRPVTAEALQNLLSRNNKPQHRLRHLTGDSCRAA